MTENPARVTRSVEFLVVSSERTAEELSAIIGMASDHSPRDELSPPLEARWSLRAEGNGATDLVDIICDVLHRVEQCIGRIERLVSGSSDSSVFRVVQYVGDDPVGPGFSLSPAQVVTLARAQATVDVDQYLDA